MKILLSIFLFVSVTAQFNAQELKQDTSKVETRINKNNYYLHDDFEFYFPRQDFTKFDIDSANIRLFSSYMLSESLKKDLRNYENEFDFLSNYHDFYIQSTKFDPIRYVLGMAEMGAVGYLAYKHIKKYGFFNK